MAQILTSARFSVAPLTNDVDEPAAALWAKLRGDAEQAAAKDNWLRSFVHIAVLSHENFASALGGHLARKLGDWYITAERLADLTETAYAEDPGVVASAVADLSAIVARDPAADSLLTPFLYFKGFHALQWHRVAHWLWGQGRTELAHFLQSRVSEVFAVDIHPAVPIGRGVFIDHGAGVVIGETAVVGNDVSILQGVTLTTSPISSAENSGDTTPPPTKLKPVSSGKPMASDAPDQSRIPADVPKAASRTRRAAVRLPTPNRQARAGRDHAPIAATAPPASSDAVTQSPAPSSAKAGSRMPRLHRKTPGNGLNACRGPGNAWSVALQKNSCSSSGVLRISST